MKRFPSSISRPKAPGRGVQGRLLRISKIYADERMSLNEGKRLKLPNRDARIPSRHACFLSPRLIKASPKNRREMMLGRKSHGVARATKNLRGVRLPLVSRSEPWKCLLPAV